jgi:hypothetical protein
MVRAIPVNALAWRGWSLCYPDCRIVGMNGPNFWDWTQVEKVLNTYGIPFDANMHRKLRLCIFEAMGIEAEQRSKKDVKNGK